MTELPSVVIGVKVTSFGVLGNKEDIEVGLWFEEGCCLRIRFSEEETLFPIPTVIIHVLLPTLLITINAGYNFNAKQEGDSLRK